MNQAYSRSKRVWLSTKYSNREKLGIITTFKCNAQCVHCLTESSPQRQEKLSVIEIYALLDAAKETGKAFIQITGGEPFVYIRELIEVAAYAHSIGLTVSIDTNGFWGKYASGAMQVVEKLLACGVASICPSASVFHSKYVPTNNIKNIIQACADLGLDCEVNFTASGNEAEDQRILSFLELTPDDYWTDGLLNTGRSVEHVTSKYPDKTPVELVDTGIFFVSVHPKGHVIFNSDISYSSREFLHTPLYLGDFRQQNVKDLILKAENDSLLVLLQSRPHLYFHQLLSSDPVVGTRYGEQYNKSKYQCLTEYFLAILNDPVIVDRLRQIIQPEIC